MARRSDIDWEAFDKFIKAFSVDDRTLGILESAFKVHKRYIENKNQFYEWAIENGIDKDELLCGTEKHVMRHFTSLFADGVEAYKCDISYSPDDTIINEFPLNHGRADIVVFHVDGTISVVEVKDGSRGYRSVVAGIGQVGFYASQLSDKVNLAGITKIRRCLAWSSTGDYSADDVIEKACKDAGVIPLISGETKEIVAAARIIQLKGISAFESIVRKIKDERELSSEFLNFISSVLDDA